MYRRDKWSSQKSCRTNIKTICVSQHFLSLRDSELDGSVLIHLNNPPLVSSGCPKFGKFFWPPPAARKNRVFWGLKLWFYKENRSFWGSQNPKIFRPPPAAGKNRAFGGSQNAILQGKLVFAVSQNPKFSGRLRRPGKIGHFGGLKTRFCKGNRSFECVKT